MVRFGRFRDAEGAVSYGISQGDGSFTYAEGCPFQGTLKDTGRKATVAKFLPPVEAQELLCIGLNYRSHADELKLPYPKNPVVFLKPRTCAVGHGAEVAKPRITEKMDYEVELAVVIGKECKDVTAEEALDYVLGYTCANDLSTRDWQKHPEMAGSQWCRSKMFDGFAPLGPVLATKDDIPDPHTLRLQSFVNGAPMQDSTTADLIFNIPQLVSFLSIGSTLLPGTVILTGTPFGVAEGRNPPNYLQPGDQVAVEIEKIGRLECSIVPDRSPVSAFHHMPKL
mmetsp:Transcript_1912/g.6377  ORF Transcript_1912/g.6377 Transcript_1912/m.6377 type:complete len:282 (+) Transcript_1912:40-885(+)